MGNVCRICHSHRNKMVPLVEESSNSAETELKVEGEEFEYCFGLKVFEVPDYTSICLQCQEQLHSFYLLKQKATKSHYELLHKAKKIKKNQSGEELSNQSEDTEKIKIDNLKTEYLNLNMPVKTELIEPDDDDELEEVEKISFDKFAGEIDSDPNVEKKTDNMDDNSRLNTTGNSTDKPVTEKKNPRVKFSRSKRYEERRTIFYRLYTPKFVYHCKTCPKRFAKEENYKAHLNTHEGLPAFSCEICGKNFNTRECYVYHMKNHNNQRDFVCDICSKAFLTKHDMLTHVKCHNSQKEYICDECGKLFTFVFQLNKHKETHSEEKHECSICHAKLNTKGTLKGHMRSVHGLFRDPKLYCTVCQKYFGKKYRLKNHMTKIHPEVQAN